MGGCDDKRFGIAVGGEEVEWVIRLVCIVKGLEFFRALDFSFVGINRVEAGNSVVAEPMWAESDAAKESVFHAIFFNWVDFDFGVGVGFDVLIQGGLMIWFCIRKKKVV